jgi:hypothetical protein
MLESLGIKKGLVANFERFYVINEDAIQQNIV